MLIMRCDIKALELASKKIKIHRLTIHTDYFYFMLRAMLGSLALGHERFLTVDSNEIYNV